MSRVLVDATGVVRGGILRVLVEALSQWPAGDELHVVGDPDVCAEIESLDVVVHPVGDGGRRSVLTSAVVDLPRLRRVLAPDAVVSFSPSLPGALLAPDVTVLHDLFFRLWPAAVSKSVRAYRTVSYRRALGASRQILCVSERTRHDLLGWLPDDAKRATVWRLAVADMFRTPPVPAPERTSIVVPAQNEFKGAGLVVDALDRDGDPPIVLLSGGGDRATELELRYRDRANPPLVLGKLTDDEKINALASARVMVMASNIEGAGLPVLEALTLRTPVVVSPDPALVETGQGFAQSMHTWSIDACRAAVESALALPPEFWERAAAVVSKRTWATAAAELRSHALDGPSAT